MNFDLNYKFYIMRFGTSFGVRNSFCGFLKTSRQVGLRKMYYNYSVHECIEKCLRLVHVGVYAGKRTENVISRSKGDSNGHGTSSPIIRDDTQSL